MKRIETGHVLEVPPQEMERQWTVGEFGLTPKERELLDSLTRDEAGFIVEKCKVNLLRNPGPREVVGIRSEDFIYFMEAVKRGYFIVSPVGDAVRSREKLEEAKYGHPVFYLSTNNAYRTDNRESFSADLSQNDRNYGQRSCIASAVQRNIAPCIAPRMWRQIDKDFDHEGAHVARETFFNEIYENLIERNNLEEVVHILMKYLPEGTPKEALANFLRSLRERSHILVTFHESISEISRPVIVDKDETHVAAPNNQVGVEHVAGYEAQGDFIDDIIEHLEQKHALW